MEHKIRMAEGKDIPRLEEILRQVNDIHADGRPDIFIHGRSKYTHEELSGILENPFTPVFVSVDDDDKVIGYCFAMTQDASGHTNLRPVKTLYIDDLCVDEKYRGQHIGRELLDYVKEYARQIGCYNVTLNVWSENRPAEAFYRASGFEPMKTCLEMIL